MKRNRLAAIGAMAVGIFLIASAQETGAAEGKAAQTLTIHAGAVGGLYMEPSVIWGKLMENAVPGLSVNAILGGSVTNPLAVLRGDPNKNIGNTNTVPAFQVQEGIGQFKGKVPEGGTDKLRALWRYNVENPTYVVARPQVVPKGVSTLGELLEKKPSLRWALKLRGSGAEEAARWLLEAYGATYEDLVRWGGSYSFNHPADQAKMLIDGHAEIVMDKIQVPASHVLDMDASVKGLVWLRIDQKAIDYMVKKFGFSPYKGDQPQKYYKSLGGKLYPTVSEDSIVFAHKDMDEKLAYQITKAVLQNPGAVKKAVPALENFDPAVIGQNTGFPLHDGAKRAFKELGFLK